MALRVSLFLLPLLALVAWLIAPYAEAAPLSSSQVEQCPTELPPGQCCIHGDPEPGTPDPRPTYYVVNCPPGMGDPITPPPPPISSTPPVIEQPTPQRPAPTLQADTPDGQTIAAGTLYADRFRVADADRIACELVASTTAGGSIGNVACTANGMTEMTAIEPGAQYELRIHARQTSPTGGETEYTFSRRWVGGAFADQTAALAYYCQTTFGQPCPTARRMTIDRRGRFTAPILCRAQGCIERARVRIRIAGRTVAQGVRVTGRKFEGRISRRDLCRYFAGRKRSRRVEIVVETSAPANETGRRAGRYVGVPFVAGFARMTYRGRGC